MEYLFAYGTLQDADVRVEVFGRQIESRPAILPGYGARPIKLGKEIHRIAVPDLEAGINGVLLELELEELEKCDSYEPREYQRQRVALASGESAWAYVAKTYL